MNTQRKSMLKRGLLAFVIALTLARVLPALADALNPTPSPAPIESAAPITEPSPTSSPSTAPENSSSQSPVAYPSATITYKMDNSDTSTPTAVENAKLTFRTPSILKVDPRATSVAIAPITIASDSVVQLCLKASTSQMSGVAYGSDLLFDEADGFTILSGAPSQVLKALSGLRLNHNPHLAGASLDFRVTAVSKANTNPEFCATPAQRLITQVKALDIGLNTVKVPVKVK